MRFITFIGLFVSLVWVSSAHAALINFRFSGVFDRVLFGAGEVSVGDQFVGSFTYDDEAPLFGVISPGSRVRYNTGEILLLSGSNSYEAIDNPVLQIFDDYLVTTEIRDDFFLSTYLQDESGPGYYLLQISMIDITHSILNSIDIPSPVKVGELGLNNFAVFLRRFESNENELWQASAFGSSLIVPVDEPSTIGLLCLGLFGLLARRKQAHATSISAYGPSALV